MSEERRSTGFFFADTRAAGGGRGYGRLAIEEELPIDHQEELCPRLAIAPKFPLLLNLDFVDHQLSEDS